MIKLSPNQIKDLQSGEKSTLDVAMNLLQNYSAMDIAIGFVEEALCNENNNISRVVLTEEQLKFFFKVKDPDEKRGRPKKIKEE